MRRLATLAVIVLALAGASAAVAAGGLGKFKTEITGHGARTDHGMLDGTWTVDFATPGSGKVNLTWNGHQAGGGTYTISGHTMTLTPKKGGGCTTKGKYRFKESGNTLTFTPISDTCTQRRDVLTFGPWTKVH